MRKQFYLEDWDTSLVTGKNSELSVFSLFKDVKEKHLQVSHHSAYCETGLQVFPHHFSLTLLIGVQSETEQGQTRELINKQGS